MRRRTASVVVLCLCAVVPAGLTAVPAAAAELSVASSSAPAAGTYRAVTPRRVLDTRGGAYGNRRGALRGGASTTFRVSGSSGVPSSAAAVVLSLDVVSAARSGTLVAAAAGHHRPDVATVSFSAGRQATDLAIVPVREGRVSLWNVSKGSSQVTADVFGYYAGGTTSAGAAYRTVAAQRVVDTLSGADHNRRGALQAGKVFTPHITGHAGVPKGAAAVVATVTVLGARKSGYVDAYTQAGDVPPPSIEVSANRPVSQLEILPLSDTGQVAIGNHTGGSVQITLDVSGYLTGGAANSANITQVDEAAHRGSAVVHAHRTVHVAMLGHSGVPRSHVAGVLVTMRVSGAGAGGRVRTGAGSAPTLVRFVKHGSGSGVVLAPLDPHGRVSIENDSSATVTVQLDVDGYVPSASVPAAPQASTARYLDDLTGNLQQDEQTMTDDGTADGRAGVRFVLLDVGAQTVTPKPTSTAHPGVALARTSGPVRLTYASLVDDVEHYISALREASGSSSVTVAVGTSSDGQWTQGKANYYGAAARGADWANKVVDPLHTSAAKLDVNVVGADDIEYQFAATEAQVETWEQSYLAATSAQLIYNGDANSCPRAPGVTRRSCTPGWTQADYYRLASNRGRVRVLPQVFFPWQATQWANIDASGSGRLDFLGSLTEHREVGSELNPVAGRAALFRALSAVRSSVSLPFAVDI